MAREYCEGRHYHVYIAGDNPGRRGAPRSLLRRGGGFLSRHGANQYANRWEPEPARRVVLQCDRTDCLRHKRRYD